MKDKMLKHAAIFLALTTGLAVAGDMRVEEPENASAPPVDPDREAGQWQAAHLPGLTPQDKENILARRKKIEAMAEAIREKREALQRADGGEKAQRTRELEDLILDGDKEKGDVGEDRGNGDDKASEDGKQIEKKAEIGQKQLEKQLQKEKARNQNGNPNDHGGGPPPDKGPKGKPVK